MFSRILVGEIFLLVPLYAWDRLKEAFECMSEEKVGPTKNQKQFAGFSLFQFQKFPGGQDKQVTKERIAWLVQHQQLLKEKKVVTTCEECEERLSGIRRKDGKQAISVFSPWFLAYVQTLHFCIWWSHQKSSVAMP